MNSITNQTSKGVVTAEEGENIIYSGIDGHYQAWDAADGRLEWDFAGTGIAKDLKLLPLNEGRRDVVILGEEGGSVGVVRKLAARSGAVLWEFRDDRYALEEPAKYWS